MNKIEKNRKRIQQIIKDKNIKRQVKFSKTWDKLKPDRFLKGEWFTTFRKWTYDKENYYWNCVGYLFKVILNNKVIGIAELFGMDIQDNYDEDGITLHTVKQDTFSHWTMKDFEDQLEKLYGVRKIKGLLLFFRIEESIHG